VTRLLTARVILSVRLLRQGRPVVLLPWFGLDQAIMDAAFEPVFAGLPGWRKPSARQQEHRS
jgi:hypothetical protein